MSETTDTATQDKTENWHAESAVKLGQLGPAIHRTRGSAEMRLIDSGAAQSALETALNTSRPVFARAVVTPW